MSQKKTNSEHAAAQEDLHEAVADDMLLGDFVEPHEVEAEVDAVAETEAPVEAPAEAPTEAPTEAPIEAATETADQAIDNSVDASEPTDSKVASEPEGNPSNDSQIVASGESTGRDATAAGAVDDSRSETIESALDEAIADEVDIAGLSLADELDELISLASAVQTSGDGTGNVAMGINDLFLSPEELAAETAAAESESENATETSAPSEQTAPQTKTDATDEIEPKATIADDDSDDMLGDFATLDDVINEAEQSDQNDATAAASVDDSSEPDTLENTVASDVADDVAEDVAEVVADEIAEDVSDAVTDEVADVDAEPSAEAFPEQASEQAGEAAVESTENTVNDATQEALDDDFGASFETVDDVVAQDDADANTDDQAESQIVEAPLAEVTDPANDDDSSADVVAEPIAGEVETEPDDDFADMAGSFETIDEVTAPESDAIADSDADVAAETNTVEPDDVESAAAEPDDVESTAAEPVAAEPISAEPIASEPVADAVDTESEIDFDDLAASFESVDEVTSPDEPVAAESLEPSAVDPAPSAADASEAVGEATGEAVGAAIDEEITEIGGIPISQIDELLAEQADTAVADDFETPGEILAAERVGAGNVNDTLHDAVDDQFDSEAGDFASPDEVAGEASPERKAVDHGTIMDAPLLQPKLDDNSGFDEPLPPTDAIEEDIPAEDSIDEIEDVPMHDELEADIAPAKRSGGIVTILVNNLYRFCEMTNRPLQGASDSTKKLVGIIGLLTVANASVIMLGKVVLSLFG